MKKVFKIISLCLIVLISGCAKSDLKENYEKMQIEKNKMTGYSLDLRIYGINGKERINEIVKITNYQNQYHIEVINTDLNDIKANQRIKEDIYIKANKVYKADANDKLKEVKDSNLKYKDPNLYLEGLNNIANIIKNEEIKIGENKYKHYLVTFKKDIVNKILDDTVLKNVEVKKNIDGEIYINDKGYIYRVIYKINNIIINANYFNINTVKPITQLNNI